MKHPSNYRKIWGREGYNEVERLHRAGLSIAAIAAALGRTEKSVARVLSNIKAYERSGPATAPTSGALDSTDLMQ